LQVTVVVETLDRLDRGEPGFGAFGHRDRDGTVQLDHGCPLEAEQLAVKGGDLRPVALRAGVTGGDRGLKLVGARLTTAQGSLDESRPLGDLICIPARPVLLLEEQEPAPRIEAGLAPRVVQKHQREQAEGLRLVRHQPHEERSEPLGIRGELAAFGRLTGRREVALVEDEVQDAKDLGQAPREL
jgi:hypothetical protein